MSRESTMIGTDGRPLPSMPPERDPRLSIRVVRVMFYVPGFTALMLLKTGEPTGFGITIEFLMLASAESVVAGPESFPENVRSCTTKGLDDCTHGGLDAAVDSKGRIYILDLIKGDIQVMARKEASLSRQPSPARGKN